MLSLALCPDSDLLAKRSAGIYTQCASEAHHHFAAIPQDFKCLLSAAFLRSYACLSPHIRSTFASVLRGLLCHVSIWYFSELMPTLEHLASQTFRFRPRNLAPPTRGNITPSWMPCSPLKRFLLLSRFTEGFQAFPSSFHEESGRIRTKRKPTGICHGNRLCPLVAEALLQRGDGGQHDEAGGAQDDRVQVGGTLAGGPADVPQRALEKGGCRVRHFCVLFPGYRGF